MEKHETEPMHTDAEARKGIHEWACVTCGYRVRFDNGVKIVITPSPDPRILHFGNTGGLRIISTTV